MHPPPSTPARLATKALCSRYNLRGSAALRASKRSAVGIALHILPPIRRRHHVPLPASLRANVGEVKEVFSAVPEE